MSSSLSTGKSCISLCNNKMLNLEVGCQTVVTNMVNMARHSAIYEKLDTDSNLITYRYNRSKKLSTTNKNFYKEKLVTVSLSFIQENEG